MSNGTPTQVPAEVPGRPAQFPAEVPTIEQFLYVVAQDDVLLEFMDKATALIREGFEPIGTFTTTQVGTNVTYLQAFWRPDERQFKT